MNGIHALIEQIDNFKEAFYSKADKKPRKHNPWQSLNVQKPGRRDKCNS
jgi:hypothetical protein